MNSVLLLSGGLDSLVLLAQECHGGQKPHCLSFDYGQRHVRELEAAKRIVATYKVPHTVLTLPPETFGGSALTGAGDVPHAHYANPSQQATVVPNRNMVFLSLAGSLAVHLGFRRVLFACHRGDWDIYPDCRPEFADKMRKAMELACNIQIETQFINMTKSEIVRIGRTLGVPFELAWSCYEGGEKPCGQCGACIERTEAEKS